MARQIVAQRKGTPVNASDDAPETDPTADVVECPNCRCQFDETSGDIVKEGAKVEGVPNENAGPDLTGSPEPTPGKFGTAADGARGSAEMTAMLGKLFEGH